MTAYEEDDLNRIARLDPLLRVAPPAPGSARYEAIREKSMTQTTIRTEPAHRPQAGRRRRLGWSAAAAGVAAAAVAAVVAFGSTGEPVRQPVVPAADAPQLLLAAAQQTGQAKTLRFEQAAHGGGNFGATGEIAGADSRVVMTGEGSSSTRVIVGDVVYSTSGGKTTREELSGDDKPVPFAEAAADVVRAVTGDADVETVGTEQVRGQESTHYRLTLKEATSAADPASPLASLPEKTLVWFDWEGLGSYSGAVTVDVWIAGNLIRRIGGAVAGQDPFATTDFYDFGAPITITAPAGS